MTDLDQLLARIDATLAECDDTQRLPNLAQTFRVPRELLDATPARIEHQLNAECAARIDDATSTVAKGTRRVERITPWWRRRR